MTIQAAVNWLTRSRQALSQGRNDTAKNRGGEKSLLLAHDLQKPKAFREKARSHTNTDPKSRRTQTSSKRDASRQTLDMVVFENRSALLSLTSWDRDLTGILDADRCVYGQRGLCLSSWIPTQSRSSWDMDLGWEMGFPVPLCHPRLHKGLTGGWEICRNGMGIAGGPRNLRRPMTKTRCGSVVILAGITVDRWHWGPLLWPWVVNCYLLAPSLSFLPLDLHLQGKSVCRNSLCHFEKTRAKSSSMKDRHLVSYLSLWNKSCSFFTWFLPFCLLHWLSNETDQDKDTCSHPPGRFCKSQNCNHILGLRATLGHLLFSCSPIF